SPLARISWASHSDRDWLEPAAIFDEGAGLSRHVRSRLRIARLHLGAGKNESRLLARAQFADVDLYDRVVGCRIYRPARTDRQLRAPWRAHHGHWPWRYFGLARRRRRDVHAPA